MSRLPPEKEKKKIMIMNTNFLPEAGSEYDSEDSDENNEEKKKN